MPLQCTAKHDRAMKVDTSMQVSSAIHHLYPLDLRHGLRLELVTAKFDAHGEGHLEGLLSVPNPVQGFFELRCPSRSHIRKRG